MNFDNDPLDLIDFWNDARESDYWQNTPDEEDGVPIERQGRSRRWAKESIGHVTGIAYFRFSTGGDSDLLPEDWEFALLREALTYLEEELPPE